MLKWKSYIIVLIIAIISVCWGYLKYGLPWNYVEAKNGFKEHLSQYKHEMVLEDVHYYIMDGRYHGWAHVAKNPDLDFYIGESRQTGEIEDGYEYEKVHLEAKKDVAVILDELLPDRESLGVELVSLERKELEINIDTHRKTADDLKQKIKDAIEDKGYVTEQLFFYVKGERY